MADDVNVQDLLVRSSENELTTDPDDKDKPLVIRGIVKKDTINQCIEQNRDFYYIDTGYLGNFPSKGNPSGKKIWHRIVKNNVQHCEVKEYPTDRWQQIVKQDPNLVWSGWKQYNEKILLVLPNPKSCKYYNIDYDTWINETVERISQYSDLPIEMRVKGSRSYRNHEYSIYDAFDTGVYATVAFNSIAALESVFYGIPAFVSVPCAASPLCSHDLSMLASPILPDLEILQNHASTLSYGQFTIEEISNGYAWKLLKENNETTPK
jgi:hypothetical protein